MGWERTVLSHPHYYTPNSIGRGIMRVLYMGTQVNENGSADGKQVAFVGMTLCHDEGTEMVMRGLKWF